MVYWRRGRQLPLLFSPDGAVADGQTGKRGREKRTEKQAGKDEQENRIKKQAGKDRQERQE